MPPASASRRRWITPRFKRSPATLLAPFSYLQIISAATLGWLVFGQLPGLLSWVGIALICLAGLGVVARLSIGVVADRFERFELIVVALLGLLLTAMLTLLVSTSWPAIGVFILCWVIGTSASSTTATLPGGRGVRTSSCARVWRAPLSRHPRATARAPLARKALLLGPRAFRAPRTLLPHP